MSSTTSYSSAEIDNEYILTTRLTTYASSDPRIYDLNTIKLKTKKILTSKKQTIFKIFHNSGNYFNIVYFFINEINI